MFYKFKKFILLPIIFCLMLQNVAFSHMFPEGEGSAIAFDDFVEKIGNGTVNYNRDFLTLNLYGRRNLLVGCSPVVYCANYGGSDLLARYDYDTIGFGSTMDADIATWMCKLKKFNYDKIVMWGSVNDIMYLVQKHIDYMPQAYIDILDIVTESLKVHLRKGGKLYYVNPKEIIYGIDTPEVDQSKIYESIWIVGSFNNLCKEVSEYMKNKGFICIDVDFPTTSEYSDWYVHYTNKKVFEKLFEDVEAKK